MKVRVDEISLYFEFFYTEMSKIISETKIDEAVWKLKTRDCDKVLEECIFNYKCMVIETNYSSLCSARHIQYLQQKFRFG